MQSHFDAMIVGAGQAGPSLAGRLTDAGWKVAVVERKLFGGTCVNAGCTPTKALVASAYAAHLSHRLGEYGLSLQAPARVDLQAVMERKDRIVANSRHGVESWLRGMQNCTVYQGTATFVAPHCMQVGEETIQADRIFLNVGARPAVPDLAGIQNVPYLTSTSILQLRELPEHLVIVGGSYIGLEFAQMFRRFGSKVTLIERAARLVPHEDEDISDAILHILQEEMIDVRLNAHCIQLKQHQDGGILIALGCTEGHPEVRGTHVLLAMGRTPNTDDLGLNAVGITPDEHGYIPVDDQLQTAAPGVWAMGDCNGRGAFTHTSYNDFEIVAANLLDHDPRRVSDRIPVHGLFIDPPLGQVGMTEVEVRKSGRPALVGIRPMSRVNRALEKGESKGVMKVLVDAESKLILGASILGIGGDEAVHCILTNMYARQPYTLLQRSVHIHPTVSELIPTVLGSLKPLV